MVPLVSLIEFNVVIAAAVIFDLVGILDIEEVEVNFGSKSTLFSSFIEALDLVIDIDFTSVVVVPVDNVLEYLFLRIYIIYYTI